VKRGQRLAFILAGVAMALFLLSLILTAAVALFPPLAGLVGVFFLLALLFGLGAVVPVFMVWQFNRAQKSSNVSSRQA
jgi:hypothetical protein